VVLDIVLLKFAKKKENEKHAKEAKTKATTKSTIEDLH
jgi:hypothetical protein